MQLFDSEYSRHSLQRWVALITGTAALAVAAVNITGIVLLYRAFPAAPNVDALLPIAVAVLLFLSGVANSDIARALQVVAFALAGLVLTVVATAEPMTSAVFIIFSLVLCYEYRTESLAPVWLTLIGLAYAVALAYSVTRAAEAAAEHISVSIPVVILGVANRVIFTGSVVFLFSLASYRQHQIRKKHESQLEALVAERTADLQEAIVQRDTMLQEIHHRVGNSLQLLASFVGLQQDEAGDAERQILKETELRVHAIADVHATLYSQHRLSHLSLKDYAADLISDMRVAYRSDVDIVPSVTTSLEAHLDFVISFGIILNELITNAAKHGDGGKERTRIEVNLDDVDNDLILLVRDSGPGFSEGIRAGIGTEVVDQLVKQNHGRIVRRNDDGAVVTATFPCDSVIREAPLLMPRGLTERGAVVRQTS